MHIRFHKKKLKEILVFFEQDLNDLSKKLYARLTLELGKEFVKYLASGDPMSGKDGNVKTYPDVSRS